MQDFIYHQLKMGFTLIRKKKLAYLGANSFPLKITVFTAFKKGGKTEKGRVTYPRLRKIVHIDINRGKEHCELFNYQTQK